MSLVVALWWCTLMVAEAAPPSAHRILQDATVAARQLAPLLAEVRRTLAPKLAVEPGTLPPSPFTGRSSTLFAVRVGVERREVDEKVVAAMDRLIAWERGESLGAEDGALVERWMDALQVKVLARLAAAGLPIDCDEVCVVQRLRNPDSVFGETRQSQQEARNDLLLDALSEAVLEPA